MELILTEKLVHKPLGAYLSLWREGLVAQNELAVVFGWLWTLGAKPVEGDWVAGGANERGQSAVG